MLLINNCRVVKKWRDSRRKSGFREVRGDIFGEFKTCVEAWRFRPRSNWRVEINREDGLRQEGD